MLNSIGAIVEGTLGKTETETVLHASSFTCFSEFPLGLAVLPGGTAPLCCRVPVAYRPVVPLTRTLQFELTPMPTMHLSGKLKVLVAECIPERDLVGRISREGWKMGKEVLSGVPNVECDIKEIGALNDLTEALTSKTYDVLVISAHGGLDNERNQTGFVCGDRLVVGEDLGSLPTIVCLSACQVSPRGKGSTNVSDLMFRQGAAVVIGTLVPVDVRRKSLEEIWHFTCTSNAVNDIVSSNEALWRSIERRGSYSVIEDFMLKRSPGTLRKNHVYQDSENVLAEIAQDHGILVKFRSWINSQGYVPESAFYVIMGWPERIVFYDPEIEKVERMYAPIFSSSV